MNQRMRAGVLCIVGCAVSLCLFAGDDVGALDSRKAHDAQRLDLANTLVFISKHYQVPIVAELSATANPKIDLPAGDETARGILNHLRTATPQYQWDLEQGVVHVYSQPALTMKGNPLNFVLQSFTLPGNASDLKIFLRARLHGASQGPGDGGIVISDFPSTELEKEVLPAKAFHNASGREILLAAASIHGTLSSIIVLQASGVQDKDLEFANTHWVWFWVPRDDRPKVP
jgi:hypothetical protein